MAKESRIISAITVGRNGQIYKSILELAARFGYLSVEEVEYEFGCSNKTGLNRLDYMVRRAGLLQGLTVEPTQLDSTA